MNPPGDRLVVRMVVGFLCLYALAALGLAGVVIITATAQHPIDPLGFGFLTTTGGTALGAVGGILAKTSSPEPGVAQQQPPAGMPVVAAPVAVVDGGG
jgi:threonine/homoserine/homoserine lactone efflux protein